MPKWVGTHAAVAHAATESLKNPPKEITATITVRGFGASRVAFASSILKAAYGLDENQASEHIMRLGAEFFIQKLSAVYKLAESGNTGQDES